MVERDAEGWHDADGLGETARLLERAKSGEASAKSELIERYSGPLQRFLHGRLPLGARAVSETQDVANTVWGRVLQKLDLDQIEYRGLGSFWSYVRGIAQGVVLDAYRSQGARGSMESLPEESSEAPASREGAVGPSLIEKEQLQGFEDSLLCLPSQSQDALLMRMELSLGYERIAEECGYPSPDAARMAITRALAKVHQEMKQRGLGE